MALCRLLSHDSLRAGVKVLNTAVKKVGRPDLPGGTEHPRHGEAQLHTAHAPATLSSREARGGEAPPGRRDPPGGRSLVLLAPELQLDPAAVGRADLLLLLQDESLQLCRPLVGHGLVQVLGRERSPSQVLVRRTVGWG